MATDSNALPAGVLDEDGDRINPATNETLSAIAGLVTSAYDYTGITRDVSGYITEVVFKTGGSGGTTVATLTIARDASNYITSITKT